jgi:hypothetical protein
VTPESASVEINEVLQNIDTNFCKEAEDYNQKTIFKRLNTLETNMRVEIGIHAVRARASFINPTDNLRLQVNGTIPSQTTRESTVNFDIYKGNRCMNTGASPLADALNLLLTAVNKDFHWQLEFFAKTAIPTIMKAATHLPRAEKIYRLKQMEKITTNVENKFSKMKKSMHFQNIQTEHESTDFFLEPPEYAENNVWKQLRDSVFEDIENVSIY